MPSLETCWVQPSLLQFTVVEISRLVAHLVWGGCKGWSGDWRAPWTQQTLKQNRSSNHSRGTWSHRDLPEQTGDYLEVPHIGPLVSVVESTSGWGMTRIRTVGSWRAERSNIRLEPQWYSDTAPIINWIVYSIHSLPFNQLCNLLNPAIEQPLQPHKPADSPIPMFILTIWMSTLWQSLT